MKEVMRGIHSSGHNFSGSFGNRAFEMLFLVNVTIQDGENIFFLKLYNENLYAINPRVVAYKYHTYYTKFKNFFHVYVWLYGNANHQIFLASFRKKKADPHKMFSNTYAICRASLHILSVHDFVFFGIT